MPLGIDATIRYALNDFSKPLTEAQLQTNSPYNTRTHRGLPPTPISNPGVASIEAAAHPAHVPYLYYVNGADGCGELVFSTSDAEFEHNAAAYREALTRNGGRVPTCRKRSGESRRGGGAHEPADAGASGGRRRTRLGVLGWPVAHSRSPAMHNAALRRAGPAGWSYQRLPVPPELFDETTRALGGAGFAGANVTIPHKQAALALADEASDAARAIGAANTLTFAPDGTIAAENTDAPGLIAAMERAGHSPRGLTALGARGGRQRARGGVGAARRGGARGLRLEPHAARARRSSQRARGSGGAAARKGRHPDQLHLRRARTTGYARGSNDLNLLGLTHDLVGRYSYVVDLVYRRRPHPAARRCTRAGVPTLDGLEMLVAQGALSLELWTGRPAPLEVMRRAAGRPPSSGESAVPPRSRSYAAAVRPPSSGELAGWGR